MSSLAGFDTSLARRSDGDGTMNIGILASFFAFDDKTDSGIAQHYRILADALAAEGHRVHVIHPTMAVDAARENSARLNPAWSCDIVRASPPRILLRCSAFSWPLWLLWHHLWASKAADQALNAATARLKLEIVETHAFNFPALFPLRRKIRPRIITRVSTTMGQMVAIGSVHSRVHRWQASLEKHVTHRSDALLTHTLQHRDLVSQLEGYDPARFAIVPHGVPDPGEPPRTPNTTPGVIRFLYVGRFDERKGIDVLLKALPILCEACPDVVFTLAGSHGEGTVWQEFAAAHPSLVGTRVHSLGRVTQERRSELYAGCDVLVAPSRYESFGLIFIEAMSYGKPVIGCSAGGMPEVITDGTTGLLAKPGDVTTLAQAMITLAKDHALRARFGRAARRDFVERFSATAMARRSVELYRTVASSSAVMNAR